MSGLLQHYHDAGYLNEGQKVLRLFLVARSDPAVLLDLGPEAFRDVTFLVQMPVVVAWLVAALQRRNHDLRSACRNGGREDIAVITLVGDHGLWRMFGQQGFPLFDVRRLSRRQDQLHRMTER